METKVENTTPATIVLRLGEVESTNLWLREVDMDNCFLVVATAEYQTGGRGQGGTAWESERGKNLTFSILTSPMIKAAEQWSIQEAVACALLYTLRKQVEEEQRPFFTIKWPNDIYWKDRKISGTLAECMVRDGLISRCIVGIGINVNQRVFISDAPNPISLWEIKGEETDLNTFLDELIGSLEGTLKRAFHTIDAKPTDDTFSKYYRENLYHKDGFYRYRDKRGEFKAEIEDITPQGRLMLRLMDGQRREYGLKEVEFL